MALLLLACEKDKEFPVVPELKVRDFNRISASTAVWRIGFTDGDGDIGVRSQTDSANFIITIYKIDNGVDSSIQGQNYRVPIVENIRTSAGIEGVIQFDITGLDFFRPFLGIDSLYYGGYLIDRSGNKSNVVYTPRIEV